MTNIVVLIGPHRYRLTRQALESLAAHTDRALTPYNLTLVCDELDFRTTALVAATIRQCPDLATCLHVENSGHTLSQLKNLGVAWSEQRWGRGEWLYLSDSDVWFAPGWLEKLIRTTEHANRFNFQLVGGQIHPFHAPEGPPLVAGNVSGGSFKAGQQVEITNKVCWTEHLILDGPSWMMPWSVWDARGPFDRTTAAGVCQSEEYSICNRLLAGGGRIGVISPHVIVHCGLTHLNGEDCVGRKEREAMIPAGVIAL